MIYFTADLHLCHDKEFIYAARGFSCIEEHDETIVGNWNSVVSKDDDVYVLGDLVLNNTEKGVQYVKQLHGSIHFIRGNHDSDNKMNRYINECGLDYLGDAKFIRFGNDHFYLSHYPSITENMDDYKQNQIVFNLFGHTHQRTNSYYEYRNMYHVGVDSHALFPVRLSEIQKELKQRYQDP